MPYTTAAPGSTSRRRRIRSCSSELFFLATEALVRGAAVDTASLAVLCCENDVLDPNRTPSKTKVGDDLIRLFLRARAAASGFLEHDEKPSSDAIKAVLQ